MVLLLGLFILSGRQQLATIQAQPNPIDPAPWGGLRWCSTGEDGAVAQLPLAAPVVPGECLRVANVETARRRRVCYAAYCGAGHTCSLDESTWVPGGVRNAWSGPLVEPARPGVCSKVWSEGGALVSENEVHG